MARHESDREDLMREATALRQRAEFRVPAETETVIAGFRTDGSLSIFLGPDPCFHFDRRCRLRRAFADGNLYRSEGITLARLKRVRTQEAVELQRHDLTCDELAKFLEQSTARLQQLHDALRRKQTDCLQTFPDDRDVQGELETTLAGMLAQPLALAPAVRKRRR